MKDRPGRRGRGGVAGVARAASAGFVLAVATLVLAAAAYGFLAAGNAGDRARGIVSSWQLFPRMVGAFTIAAVTTAGLASVAVTGGILLSAALFGRWYCAALCPLGTLQDLAARLGGRKNRYRHPATTARILAFVGVAAIVLVGSPAAASWLDPWSLFGRFVAYDLRPIALVAARADVPGFDPWVAAAAGAAMSAVLVLALFRGRWFCGTLCPVGGLLGLLSRAAPFRLRIDTATCNSCGACAAVCPASCADSVAQRVDDSRCLYCMACVAACPTGAVHYGRARRGGRTEAARGGRLSSMTRSGFILALGGGAAALALAAFPGRALTTRLPAPARPTTPPGSRSLERFLGSCTACGLCASACPSGVLQPSLGQLGLRGFLAPRLDYAVSYCQYECVTCLDLCPSGALERLPLVRKKLVKMGDATLVRDRCIVFVSKTKCGACAEHCPTGAVRMVDAPTGIPEPLFTTSICIGCGACHHACPTKPLKAITVSGLAVHTTAAKPTAALLGVPPARLQAADQVRGGDGAVGDDSFPF